VSVGRGIGKVQPRGAVAVHGRAGLGQVQLAAIDLAQVDQQLGGQAPAPRDEPLEPTEKLGVAEPRKRLPERGD